MQVTKASRYPELLKLVSLFVERLWRRTTNFIVCVVMVLDTYCNSVTYVRLLETVL